jgi:hypothetical protein
MVLEPIGINDIGKMSGGDSIEEGVRKAVTYFGVEAFIDKLNVDYTPPTIGE